MLVKKFCSLTHLKLMPGKLHCMWEDPFMVIIVSLHGAVEIKKEGENKCFKVNVHRLKCFCETPTMTVEEVILMDPLYPLEVLLRSFHDSGFFLSLLSYCTCHINC